MNTVSYIALALFIGINTAIVSIDIWKRKIPNTLLLLLIAIFPFWISIFPLPNIYTLFAYGMLAIGLLLGGIFLYKEEGFLGAGDLKYAAVLSMFLSGHSLAQFIGNIGVLTLITLCFWWSIALRVLFISKSSFLREEGNRIFSPIKLLGLLYKVPLVLLDWIVVGFFLVLLIQKISFFIFAHIPTNSNFYFLVGLLLFLLRPSIHYTLVKWRYRLFPIIGMMVFFGSSLVVSGLWECLSQLIHFVRNIGMYILAYMSISFIVRETFLMYDRVLTKDNSTSLFHTIPFSLILFLAFICTYFFDISFLDRIKLYF